MTGKSQRIFFLSPRLFLTALQFLTVIRPAPRLSVSAAELGGAVGFYPLVGLVVGALLWGLQWALSLWLPPLVVAALVLAAWILLSGALHLDGFLDACDGLFGGNTPEQRLEIMRDEAIGAFAFAGGAALVLTEFAVLGSGLPGASLLLAPVLGRWAMALSVVAFPYARKQGLGSDIKAQAGWTQAALATVIALTAAWLAAGWLGLAALAAAGLLVALSGRLFLSKVPGYTGDLYGATCILAEVLALVILVSGVA